MVDANAGVGVKALPRTRSLKHLLVGRVSLKPYGQRRTYGTGRVIKCRNGGKIHFEIGPGAISKARERQVGRAIMRSIANRHDVGLNPSPVSKSLTL